MTAATLRAHPALVSADLRSATLDNGLRLVVRRDRGMTGCAVAVNYRAGFRDEPADKAGFAHLFEHLMFQGSRDVPGGGHFAEIQAAGGTVNGNTYADHADYNQSAPLAALDRILALEADRMAHLRLTQRNLDVQRKVVSEEINLQLRGRPYGGFPWTVLPSALYARWVNAHNGFGTTMELDTATVAGCAEFYDRYYAPANAVVAVCTDADPDDVLRLAATHFERLAYRRPPDHGRPGEPMPAPWRDRTVLHPDALAPRPALALGWPVPDTRTSPERYAAMIVLSAVLTGGTHAVLRAALRPLLAVADTSVGLFGPYMAVAPDTFVLVVHHDAGTAERVQETVDAVLAEVAEGAHDARVDPARLTALTELHQRLDAPAFRARYLARGALLFGTTELAGIHRRQLSAVTAPDVRTAAAALASDPGRGLVTLQPTTAREQP